MSSESLWSQLRGLLSHELGVDSWKEILAILGNWPGDEERDMAIEYTKAHWESLKIYEKLDAAIAKRKPGEWDEIDSIVQSCPEALQDIFEYLQDELEPELLSQNISHDVSIAQDDLNGEFLRSQVGESAYGVLLQGADADYEQAMDEINEQTYDLAREEIKETFRHNLFFAWPGNFSKLNDLVLSFLPEEELVHEWAESIFASDFDAA